MKHDNAPYGDAKVRNFVYTYMAYFPTMNMSLFCLTNIRISSRGTQQDEFITPVGW